MKTSNGRIYRNREEWQHHLTAWRQSGMKMTTYAKTHGLNLKSFSNAQRRLSGLSAKTESVKKPLFKPVVVTPSPTHSGVYRVNLPDGVIVTCDSDCDLVAFSNLVQQLRTLR